MSTEQYAAATLLDKGVKVRVTAPLLFRMIGIKSVSLVIIAPNLGSLKRISYLYLSSGITTDELAQINEVNAHDLFIKYGPMLAKVIATAWLHGYWRGMLLTWVVWRWLYWHLNHMQLLTATNMIAMMGNVESFTSSIRLVADMKMTTPNLSQKSQGS